MIGRKEGDRIKKEEGEKMEGEEGKRRRCSNPKLRRPLLMFFFFVLALFGSTDICLSFGVRRKMRDVG